jgi:hypothetical protein
LRGFVLAADDFGISRGVSQTIVPLIAQGRLSATGCMTNLPAFAAMAPALAELAAEADIGLHLNLTCGAPPGAGRALAPDGRLPGLARLARGALASAAVRQDIAAAIARQLDAFEAAFGRPPDYLDGHQHCHVLPRIRGLVLAELKLRYPLADLYLRDPFDTPGAIIARGVAVGKALTIAGLALGLGRQARRAGFATNAGFAGVRVFDPAADFGGEMRRFLMAAGPRHLVMCHPGSADDAELAALDPVVASRPVERDLLGGPAFAELLAELGFAPRRFRLLAEAPAQADDRIVPVSPTR